jgi:hypothetical protein
VSFWAQSGYHGSGFHLKDLLFQGADGVGSESVSEGVWGERGAWKGGIVKEKGEIRCVSLPRGVNKGVFHGLTVTGRFMMDF